MDYRKIDSLLHGGDYNVEQWLERPDVLKEDIRLMKKARVNIVTLGVFSWACFEPQENVYTFEWLDRVMDSMYENGIYVILATPSAGKPPWMIKKYPEIMRTESNRIRLLYGERENQCNSSKVFREKVQTIDSKLAERYSNHPALIMWHISNEMYGICHCEECQKNFRKWLKNKYYDIENLNHSYWSVFWSHKYNDWSEIESPAPHGETAVHGLALDYKRFYSELSIDFLEMEINAVKKYNPNVPVTTNMFHFDCGIDYGKLSKVIDIASWDSYPRWHCGKNRNSEWDLAVKAAFVYDYCRSLKNKPFLLMESTPSTSNGFDISKLKRPKLHMLSSMQAISAGSDSVQYFQWRKSRGAYEKFHGAVISHNSSENTRVFKDVTEVGEKIKNLSYLKNTNTVAEVAVIYDWENMRALYEQKNLRKQNKDFDEIVVEHYESIIKNYVSVDIIDQDADFSKYKLIIAPMLYMFKNGTNEKIRNYIAGGGNFVMTYYSGIVNENDLVFESYPPYSLNDVFGVKSEEIDCICDDEYNQFSYNNKIYKAIYYCDLIDTLGAEVISRYERDFYKDMPVLIKNNYQKGFAYYIACRTDKDFLYDYYSDLINEIGIKRIIDSEFINDVMVKERCDNENKYLFIMNFSVEERTIDSHVLNGYDFDIKSKLR